MPTKPKYVPDCWFISLFCGSDYSHKCDQFILSHAYSVKLITCRRTLYQSIYHEKWFSLLTVESEFLEERYVEQRHKCKTFQKHVQDKMVGYCV